MGYSTENMRFSRVWRSTNQTLTTATPAAISFDTVVANKNGLWASGSPTKFTVDKPGYYLVTGQAEFAADVDGTRQLSIRKNGSATALLGCQRVANLGAGLPNINVSAQIFLAAGDYVELVGLHDAGNDLVVTAIAAQESPSFSIALIKPIFDASLSLQS